MKIAIHKRDGSFSDSWIKYCEKNNIQYKIVNCYDNDIIQQVEDCDILMWHHHHDKYEDILLAKQLTNAFEHSQKIIFPDFNTAWHFDDKVGQKYLLETIKAPLVKSYVFYDKNTALQWVVNATFPKVFKLRGGAGSANVQLIRDKQSANRIIKKAFGQGFSPFNRLGYLKNRLKKFRGGKDNLFGVIKGFAALVIPFKDLRYRSKEKGYVYFQDFIPGNDSDTRIIVIGKKAFGIKRLVRDNDFRASGSGSIIHSKEEIDERCVSLAFEISDKCNFQCMAYDFVFNDRNEPLLIEISFGFSPAGYADCPGYWDHSLLWHNESFDPYGWMIEFSADQLNQKTKELHFKEE